MNFYGEFQSAIRHLMLEKSSGPFHIRYCLRDPSEGAGQGVSGIRHPRVLDRYLTALDLLYREMTGPVHARPGLEWPRIDVYVFELSEWSFARGSPFTAPDIRRVPFIGLPSRSNEPTLDGELHRAAAIAVHEATHVFNYRQRPYYDPYSAPWDWFDEATAVAMEALVLPDNQDHLRFGMNWCDRPDIPLDDVSVQYESYRFALYLVRRYGVSILSRMWLEGRHEETPLQTLRRLISAPAEGPLELFSDYCTDSYFIRDPTSDGYAQQVYSRYGYRAVLDSLNLKPGQTKPKNGVLDHLACHYYRFSLHDGVQAVSVRISPHVPTSTLTAELAQCKPGGIRGQRTLLSNWRTEGNALVGSLRCSKQAETDHIVLTVANSGTDPAQHDAQGYSLTISAQ